MSASDDAWLCPLHPFGHQWTGRLSCSLCGAERSAADAIVSGLGHARGWSKADAERALDAHRADVRAEALAEAANMLACLGPVDSLVSAPQAWTEAIETLRAAASGDAAAPVESAAGETETAEFGLRLADGSVHKHGEGSLEQQERALKGYLSTETKTLVQRTVRYGAWTEVQ